MEGVTEETGNTVQARQWIRPAFQEKSDETCEDYFPISLFVYQMVVLPTDSSLNVENYSGAHELPPERDPVGPPL